MRNYKLWITSAMAVLIMGFALSLLSNTSGIEDKNKEFKPALVADGFDFPVGPPNAEGYYNAQAFTKNNHLGDDWNANSGGNTDLGDPVYAIANGVVTEAEDHEGGWGNVIRIKHQLKDGTQVESLYAHCDTILIKVGDQVKKGDQIGTIGDAHGAYYAHLHFEIREKVGMPLGGGYSSNTNGYLDPTAFIEKNR